MIFQRFGRISSVVDSQAFCLAARLANGLEMEERPELRYSCGAIASERV